MALEFGQLAAVSVTASTANEAHAHGMTYPPDIVVLTHPSHADVAVGTTDPDATSVYLTNVNVGAQVCDVLMIAL